jgi:hypothetical protein
MKNAAAKKKDLIIAVNGWISSSGVGKHEHTVGQVIGVGRAEVRLY